MTFTFDFLILDLDLVLLTYLSILGIPLALMTGIYTSWLFGQAKGRSWSEDSFLTLKFLLETLALGGAVFFPLATMEPIYAVIGSMVLILAWLHDKKLVQDPQLEALL